MLPSIAAAVVHRGMRRECLHEIECADTIDRDTVPEPVVAARPDEPRVAARVSGGIERDAAVHVAEVRVVCRLEMTGGEAGAFGFIEDRARLRRVLATSGRHEREQHEGGRAGAQRGASGRERRHGSRSPFWSQGRAPAPAMCGVIRVGACPASCRWWRQHSPSARNPAPGNCEWLDPANSVLAPLRVLCLNVPSSQCHSTITAPYPRAPRDEPMPDWGIERATGDGAVLARLVPRAQVLA